MKKPPASQGVNQVSWAVANPVRHSLAGILIGSMPDGEGMVYGILGTPCPAEK